MLTDAELSKLLGEYQAMFQGIEDEYLEKMAEHIQELGHLTASDINRLTEMKRMRLVTKDTQKKIASAAGVTGRDMTRILKEAAKTNLDFAGQWFGKDKAVPMSDAVRRTLEAQIRVSKGEFANLARTTVDSTAYRKALDVGIRAVQSGVTDYKSAIRRSLEASAMKGLRVVYPPKVPGGRSYTRRADSAVRMNILDGVRSLNNSILRQVGEEYGADGVEISAHVLCAPDHLDVQGRQYTKDAFYGPGGIEETLRRKFGTCNCKHTVHPIIVGVSVPAYSDEQLAEINRLSTEPITIGEGDGARTMTRYQWSQEQRRIETSIRQQKDKVLMSGGDPEIKRTAQRRIDELNAKYDDVINGAGLRSSRDRMAVDGWSGNGVGNASKEQLRKGESWKIPEAKATDHYTMATFSGTGGASSTPAPAAPQSFRDALQSMVKANPNPNEPFNGAYSTDELRSAGRVIQDEVSKRMAGMPDSSALKAKLDDILTQYNAASAKYKASWRNDHYEEAKRLYDEWYKLKAEYDAAKKARGDVFKTVLGEWRSLGGIDRSNWKTVFGGMRYGKGIEYGIEGLNYYPTDWIKALQDAKSKRGYGFDMVAMQGRAYFQNGSVHTTGVTGTTIHEMGHGWGWLSDVLHQQEAAFYDERTRGEALQRLRDVTGNPNYDIREVTRLDNFSSPYMGKDYRGAAYELCSMGFESAFTKPDLLHKDLDMEAWIYGILAMM